MIFMIFMLTFSKKINMGKRKKNVYNKRVIKGSCVFTHVAGRPRLSVAFELVLCFLFDKCACILDAYLGMGPDTTQLGLVCVFKEINRFYFDFLLLFCQ